MTVRFESPQQLHAAMTGIRRDGWICEGQRLWVKVERTPTEAQAQRPAPQAQLALRSAFPNVAGAWTVERASKRVYDDEDDMPGDLVEDDMHMSEGGLAKLGVTPAECSRRIVAAAARRETLRVHIFTWNPFRVQVARICDAIDVMCSGVARRAHHVDTHVVCMLQEVSVGATYDEDMHMAQHISRNTH